MSRFRTAALAEALEHRTFLSGAPQAVMVSRTPAVLQDFDRTTGALTNPRTLSIDGVMDVEFDGDGNLYAITDSRVSKGKGEKNSLYKVDPATGQVTLIGPLGVGDLFEGDMAWDPVHKNMRVVTDRLNGGAVIHTVNLTTGAAGPGLRLGVDGQQPFDSDGIAIDPKTGFVHIVDGGYNGPLYGYTYDPDTGQLKNQVAGSLVMGTTGGLAYDSVNNRFILGSGGTDFGFGKKGSYIYNPDTGVTTPLGDGGDYSGLAFGYPEEEAPTITIDSPAINEGDPADSRQMEFKLTLNHPAKYPITVRVTTADQLPGSGNPSATAGVDYMPKTGVVTFHAGETEAFFRVRIIGDNTPEENEVFYANLSDAMGATIRTGTQGFATILNDDPVGKGKLKIVSVLPLASKSTANEFDVQVTVKNTSLSPLTDTLLLTSYVSADQQLDLGVDEQISTMRQVLSLRQAESQKFRMVVDIPPVYLSGGSFLVVRATLVKSKENEVASTAAGLPAVNAFGNGKALVIPDPKDAKNPLVTFKTSKGSGSVDVDKDGKITLKLNKGADATVDVKKGKSYSIKGVEAENAIKGLKALGIDIEKDINLKGGAESVAVKSVRDGHTILLGGSPRTPVSLSLGRVAETTISSTQPIISLAVTEWQDNDGTEDTITAPSIGKITSAGDFEASVRTAGGILSLSVAGRLGSGTSSRREIRATGAIGTVTAARFSGVNILSGLTSDSPFTALPTVAADFAASKSLIESIKVTGKGPGLFANSAVAARTIRSLVLSRVDTASAPPLGVSAITLTTYTRDGKTKPTNKVGVADSDGNFSVNVIAKP